MHIQKFRAGNISEFFNDYKVQNSNIYLKQKCFVTLWMSLQSLFINLMCPSKYKNNNLLTTNLWMVAYKYYLLTSLGFLWSAWWPDSRAHPWGTPSLFPTKPKQVVMKQMYKFAIPLKRYALHLEGTLTCKMELMQSLSAWFFFIGWSIINCIKTTKRWLCQILRMEWNQIGILHSDWSICDQIFCN